MIDAMEERFQDLCPAVRAKLDACRDRIRPLGRVVVAYSGGVDSTLLLALAIETLGRDNVLAVTGDSPIHPRRQLESARRLARQLGAELMEVKTNELHDPAFVANPPNRCYHCKSGLLTLLRAVAEQRGAGAVLDGANADDTGDFRPGLEAGRQLGAVRPLLEAGLTKADIRAASRALGLETWNEPSAPCLATRIPYGEAITEDKLSRIERAEGVLHELGFRPCRIRDHGGLARIEVPREQVARAAELCETLTGALKGLGYTYITLDLEGFRTGSMNEILDPKTLAAGAAGGT